VGRDVAWKFLVDNWRALSKHFDVKSSAKLGQAVKGLADRFTEPDQLDNLVSSLLFSISSNKFRSYVILAASRLPCT
jgi:hypothetical protein